MSRRSSESREFSATPLDWLVASGRSALYGSFFARHAERELFPGVLLIVLPLIALLCGPDIPVWPRSRRPDKNVWPTRALDVGIIIFTLIAIVVALLPLHGADVPTMLAVVCASVRFAPWLRTRIARSRFTMEESSAALWIVIGVLGSFGEHAFLHSFLFRVVEPFRASRVPARWAMIAYVGLAVWAAIGATRFRKGAIALI